MSPLGSGGTVLGQGGKGGLNRVERAPFARASLSRRALLEGPPTSEQRIEMAADLDKEVAVHRQGYEKFITLLRSGAVICLILAFIVILLIAK
jgi:hypothetical protein